MKIGDTVVRKSHDKDVAFKIIGIKEENNKTYYILKGINLRIIADAPIEDLEILGSLYNGMGKMDEVFNEKVNGCINNILMSRSEKKSQYYRIPRIIPKIDNKSELVFGRPGKVLHVDGDGDYLEMCLKVYKQLSLDVIGKVIKEVEQPKQILQLVKKVKPDIVVITGHDGMVKNTEDFMDLNNYRHSKYFVQCVSELRNYQSSYDELVIFAGACQSCYEAILDAGANYASSPDRVLIHCLDPVFICEKIAYTNVEKVVSIRDVIENTITGIKGVGGLQTRGKYREGLPKSHYIK